MAQRLFAEHPQQERHIPTQPKFNQKASKMNQIDTYVTILIQNNRAYAEQLSLIRNENLQAKGQIEIILRDKLLQKQHFEQQIDAIKRTFSQEISKLVDELRDILLQKQQMEASYKMLIDDLSNQTEVERKSRHHQMEQMERNHQKELAYLNERLMDQSRESEKHYYLNSENKVRFVQEIDALNYQINESRKRISDLTQENRLKTEEIAKLAAVIKVLSKEKDDLGLGILKMQQDKNQSLIELKKINCTLRTQLDVCVQNIKLLEDGLANKQNEYSSLTDRNHLLIRDLSALEDHAQTLAAKDDERQNSFNRLKAQYSKLTEDTSKEIKRMSELIKLLETDNTTLLGRQQELETQNSIKQQEIYTLLDKVEKTQRDYELTTQQYYQNLQEVQHLKATNSHLQEKLQSLELELQNEQHKSQLQLNSIHTLEMMITKQKKRTAALEVTCAQKENIPKNTVPVGLRGGYDHYLQDPAKQAIDLKDHYEGERQQMIRSYERALREKQAAFKQKILRLERDVLELSRA